MATDISERCLELKILELKVHKKVWKATVEYNLPSLDIKHLTIITNALTKFHS